MIQRGVDFGFCGPYYQAPMQLQAFQNCINYYAEIAEVENAKMPIALLGTPGLNSLASVVNSTLYTGTMTAGSGFGSAGFVNASYGSVSPNTDVNGYGIDELIQRASNSVTFALRSAAALGQSYFTTLTLNATALQSAAATYVYNGTDNVWTWSGVQTGVVSGQQYNWSYTTNVSEVRGAWVLPGGTQALVVIGPTVYLCSSSFALTAVGTLKTYTGPVCIRDNGALFGGQGGYAILVDGTYGYYYLLGGTPLTVSFTGGFTSGSPTITVPSIPAGLVISPGVRLTDTGGAIGTPTTLYSGSLVAGEDFTSGTPYTASITAGAYTDVSNTNFVGYSDGVFPVNFGSGFVTQQGSLPSNLSVIAVYDNTSQGQAGLYITGFTADPGQNAVFSSINLTGGPSLASTAANYSYSGGTASWIWPSGTLGFVNGQNATLNIQVDIVAHIGFRGSGTGTFGTLTPGTVSGNTINLIYQDNAGSFWVAIAAASDPTQTFFSDLTINGQTYAAISANYTYNSGVATWQFTGAAGLANAGTYPVTMTATASGTAQLTGFDVNTPSLTMSINAAATVASDSVTATIPIFGQITDPGFLGSSRVAFIEGYLIFAQPNTRTFFTTGPDPYTVLFPGTWYALKDSSSDNIVTIHENNRELWLIGARTTEVWYNAGNAPGVAFARIPAVGPQMGCAAVNSISRCDQQLLWLAANEQGQNLVVMQQQYNCERISSHGVEYEWSQYTTVSDAIGYSYEEQGHWFYVLTFPTANATWVYDKTASANAGKPYWHRRASNVVMNSDGSLASLPRHRSNCYMNFQNTRVVGDYTNGNLYEMSRAYNTDAGTPIVSQRRSPHAWSRTNRKRLFYGWLQVEFTPGVGNTAQPNPQAQLRCSSDGGFTWNTPQLRPMGGAGATKTRTIWTRLGRARDRVFEVTVRDPVPRDIIGVTLFFEPEAEEEAA